MKIKLFNSILFEHLEIEINKWIEENKPEIISTSMNVSNMNDRFYDGNIANQWQDYTFTIVYK